MKKTINDWIKERKKIINRKGSNDARVDELAEQIVAGLRKNFKSLECDFILESMTELGAAPSVLYDDNGMWAVIADGTQPMVGGNDRLEGHIGMTFFAEKEQWHNTIRKALKHYLFARE
jgi:hypothetical protein